VKRVEKRKRGKEEKGVKATKRGTKLETRWKEYVELE
jgi:hypothetical protein